MLTSLWHALCNYLLMMLKQQPSTGYQVTDACNRLITVLIQDKETGQIIGKQIIKRALLAKYFHEQRVVGAKDGLFKVQF